MVRLGYGIFFEQNFYPGWNAGIATDGFNTTASFTSSNGGLTPAFLLQNGFPQNFKRPPFIDSTLLNGQGAPATEFIPYLGNRPGFALNWQFPMLIAAIDPAAEARLDGLDHALTWGRYLPETGFGTGSQASYFQQGEGFPVLAASGSGIGEYSVSRVQERPRLSPPPISPCQDFKIRFKAQAAR